VRQCHPRKVFVGGLTLQTSTLQFRRHFEKIGAVVDAHVRRWPDGRSRGFGYVRFSEASAASQALQEQHIIDGREVEVKRAVPSTNKLFVGGLSKHSISNDLREHFEHFGEVSYAMVMIDLASGRSRGFGFVCFTAGQEGAGAVQKALGPYTTHWLQGTWIDVKCAEQPHFDRSSSSSGVFGAWITASPGPLWVVDGALSSAPVHVPTTLKDLEPQKIDLPQSPPLLHHLW